MEELLPAHLGSGLGICRLVLTPGSSEPGENAPIDSPVVAAIEPVCPGEPLVMRKEQQGVGCKRTNCYRSL